MTDQEVRELVAEANSTPNTCWGRGYEEAQGYYRDPSPLDRASAQPVPMFPEMAHEDTWLSGGNWNIGLPFMNLFD